MREDELRKEEEERFRRECVIEEEVLRLREELTKEERKRFNRIWFTMRREVKDMVMRSGERGMTLIMKLLYNQGGIGR